MSSIYIYHEQNDQLNEICEHFRLSKSKVICKLINDEYKNQRLEKILEEEK